MSNKRDSFLAGAGWADAAHSPVAGDLSVRQYTRLSKGSASSILMECDPAIDTSLSDFLKMTEWLRAQDLSAPEIFAADTTAGFTLLEDFGNAQLTTLIAQDPSCQMPRYDILLDTLITIRNAPPPRLATPSARMFCEATKLVDIWYPAANTSGLDAFRYGLETILEKVLRAPATVSLRDFHADNIIWLPQRTNARRPGLLDYQDAFLTHPVYDLMSLLTDARTDVAPNLRREMIEVYAYRTGDSIEALTEAFSAFGAQRNLRILGIFARAARRDGKTQHLKVLPRVYGYLSDCCSHPSLAPFAGDLTAALPAPDARMIESLAL